MLGGKPAASAVCARRVSENSQALSFLTRERERMMRLSRQEAIQEVLDGRKLNARVQAVKSVAENGLLDIGGAQ